MSTQLALLVIGGSAIAGFVSGLAGFAFGLVAMVFWAWTLPPQAIGPMLRCALDGGYAVGYFESWNLESLQGVIDAGASRRWRGDRAS